MNQWMTSVFLILFTTSAWAGICDRQVKKIASIWGGDQGPTVKAIQADINEGKRNYKAHTRDGKYLFSESGKEAVKVYHSDTKNYDFELWLDLDSCEIQTMRVWPDKLVLSGANCNSLAKVSREADETYPEDRAAADAYVRKEIKKRHPKISKKAEDFLRNNCRNSAIIASLTKGKDGWNDRKYQEIENRVLKAKEARQ